MCATFVQWVFTSMTLKPNYYIRSLSLSFLSGGVLSADVVRHNYFTSSYSVSISHGVYTNVDEQQRRFRTHALSLCDTNGHDTTRTGTTVRYRSPAHAWCNLFGIMNRWHWQQPGRSHPVRHRPLKYTLRHALSCRIVNSSDTLSHWQAGRKCIKICDTNHDKFTGFVARWLRSNVICWRDGWSACENVRIIQSLKYSTHQPQGTLLK